MRFFLPSFAIIAACTPAQNQAFDVAISQGSAAVVPAEVLACEVATEFDPSGATAVCAVVDAAGTVIGAAFTVAEDVQSIAALVAKAKPLTPPTASALMAARLSLHPRGTK